MSPRFVALAAAGLFAFVVAPEQAIADTPLVEITEPVRCPAVLNPASVNPISTFGWQTVLGSTDPAEVRHILLNTAAFGNSFLNTLNYIRTVPNAPEWSAWEPYLSPDVGTSWTTPPLDYGNYVFAVHGRDSEGNTDTLFVETRNAIRIRIAARINGPQLTLKSPYHDPVVSFLPDTPTTTHIDLPTELPIVFCWTADACFYGGSVVGYRYAWDLTDPDDDAQWGMAFTPFTGVEACSPEMELVPYGPHVFYVEAIDNSGYKSRASVEVTWRQIAGPAQPWSRRFGDASVQHSIGVAVDGAGDVLIVGDFDGTFSLGGGSFTGTSDMFLAKLNRFGTHVWSKPFINTGMQNIRDVAVEANGNVYIAGDFFSSINLGGSDLTSTAFKDVFVAKYDASGAHQWSQKYGGTNYDLATSIDADASGVAFTGQIWGGSVNFGGSPLGIGIFVVKLDADGNHLWSRSLGGSSSGLADVQLDAASKVALAGNFTGTIDFGPGPIASLGGNDVFVAKLDPQGNHLWSRRAGDTDNQYGAAVAVDPAGNVTATGAFFGAIDLGTGSLVSDGLTDVFVAGFADDGTPQWSERFGDAVQQAPTGVAAGPEGNIVVTGYYSGTMDFGGGPLTSAGSADFFVAKFDAQGNHIRSKQYGDAANQLALRVTVDNTDDAIVYGEFHGSVDFGSGLHTSLGSQDLIVARLDSSIPVDVEPTVIPRAAVRNYPNPFNPSTTIVFEVPVAGRVQLAVYDARGSLVRTLVDGALPAGPRREQWDGRDQRGRAVASGVYFVRLEAGGETASHKVTLLK